MEGKEASVTRPEVKGDEIPVWSVVDSLLNVRATLGKAWIDPSVEFSVQMVHELVGGFSLSTQLFIQEA